MMSTLEQQAAQILRVLAAMRSNDSLPDKIDGEGLRAALGYSIKDINDAFWMLKRSGYVDSVQYLETRDYDFTEVWITPLGRFESERTSKLIGNDLSFPATQSSTSVNSLSLPPAPIGSPYGFTDEDWEFITRQRSLEDHLIVVLGYQFRSDHYDSALLRANVEKMFSDAVARHNRVANSMTAKLVFRPLAAGYGEHLFNEIARSIIAADIAVFDTSDLNPNVMLELGVALTWGVRVLPMKLHSQPPPPSDISGQTWTSYSDSGSSFMDNDHEAKLDNMVERAIRKKGRHRQR